LAATAQSAVCSLYRRSPDAAQRAALRGVVRR